jgi:hypothetical protein
MLRVVLAAGSGLLLGAVAASWLSAAGGYPDARVAAAGLAEVAVVAAMLDVGRRPPDDGFGGAATT